MIYSAKDLQKIQQKLRERLTQQLPGSESHAKMIHAEGRKLLQYTNDLPPPKKAAVLITLFPHNDNIATLLIMRADNDKVHGGQIGFPGGRCEPSDQSPEFTALREANEEVGLIPDKLVVLGTLSDLYIRASNFLIKPVVAVTDHSPVITLNHSEVKYTIIVSLHDLLQGMSHCDVQVRGLLLRNVPSYITNGQIIWGATAMMISELLDLMPAN